MKTQKIKEPKFKIGDTVRHRPDLYDLTISKVTEITRRFWTGDRYDLATLERDLPFGNEDIKHEIKDIDGVPTLIIEPWLSSEWSHKEGKHVPAMTKRELVPFHSYTYIVKNEKMNTIIGEKYLTKL